nr:hypothetical protein [Valsa mali var. pyri (nom. inval.)]
MDWFLSNFENFACSSLFVFKRAYSSKSVDNKFTANFKNKYELTTEQQEALVGIILADGFIERAKPTHNARLTVEQVYPDQEAYLLSIRDLFAPLIKMEPFIVSRKADLRTKFINLSWLKHWVFLVWISIMIYFIFVKIKLYLLI